MSLQLALGYYWHLFIVVFDRSTGRAQLSLPLLRVTLETHLFSSR